MPRDVGRTELGTKHRMELKTPGASPCVLRTMTSFRRLEAGCGQQSFLCLPQPGGIYNLLQELPRDNCQTLSRGHS